MILIEIAVEVEVELELESGDGIGIGIGIGPGGETGEYSGSYCRNTTYEIHHSGQSRGRFVKSTPYNICCLFIQLSSFQNFV